MPYNTQHYESQENYITVLMEADCLAKIVQCCRIMPAFPYRIGLQREIAQNVASSLIFRGEADSEMFTVQILVLHRPEDAVFLERKLTN